MSNLRRQFSRVGRTHSYTPSNSGTISRTPTAQSNSGMVSGGMNGSMTIPEHVDEHSPLILRNTGDLESGGSYGLLQQQHDQDMHQQEHQQEQHEQESALIRWPKSFGYLTWRTLTSNYVNILLVFVPAGIVLGALDMNPTAVFIVNFIAIIPLAALLSFATEELSIKMGQTIGGLMNATFGNAVELIVSIVALLKGEIRIVQASMLGSILSNILLVLGCCFIASGLRRDQSSFNETVASTMSSLMAVAATSLIIPATLYSTLKDSTSDTEGSVLILSRGTAIMMLLLYCLYLFFQLKTHAKLFDGENDEAEPQEPEILNPFGAGVCLVLVTILVAICAEYLVDSIDSIVTSSGVSKTFIGLILLPIVGNAAEHATACVVAWKGKMDLAIGVALGSSMQIALFVTPFLVMLGWIIDQPMTLRFETFETVVFFLSVLVVNYLIQDGKSNYLEGCMCLGTYIIIAVAFFVYPEDAGSLHLPRFW